MKKIPENILVIVRATIPLIVIIVLFVILGQLGIGKVSVVRDQISTARHDQVVLTQKLDLLRTVAITGVQDSNIATNSLPDGNPSLAVISQLKSLAAKSGLVLTSIKAAGGAVDTGDLNNVAVGFSVLGGRTEVESFLGGIGTFVPLSVLESVRLTESGGGFLGDVTVKSFWSALPTKLPATIEEFSDLTQDDKQVLANISTLTQPTFLSLPPSGAAGKADPFSP